MWDYLASAVAIQTSFISTVAVDLVNNCNRNARNQGKIRCTVQPQVEIPASNKVSPTLQNVELSIRQELVSSISQTAAAAATISPPSSFDSAAHQLEISVHQLKLLPKQLDLPSVDGSEDDRLHSNTVLSFEDVKPLDERLNLASDTQLQRKKRTWQGVRKQRRKPIQPAWTVDDFRSKATCMLESVLSESYEGRSSVEDVLDSWLGKITRVELTMLMKDLGVEKQPSLAVEVFYWMQKQKGRLKPNPHAFSTIIGVLGRAGIVNKAWEIFVSQKEKKWESIYLYNAMMGVYVKAGNFKRAWKLYEDLCDSGLEANEVTFNTLLSGVSRAGMPLKTVQRLFSKMKLVGISPDPYTYNTLIMAFSKAGNLEGAAAILKEMRFANLMPDLCTFNTVINMYGRERKHKEGLRVFRSLRAAGLDPDTATYTNLMQLCSRAQNLEASIALFTEMQVSGCKPDAMTYSFLIDTYGKMGLVNEAEQTFKKMQGEGFTPDLVAWTSLIQAYGKSHLLEKAGSCLMKMQKSGCRPDVVVFNILMNAYEKASLPIHAASLFRKMQSQGIAPNAKSFDILIHTFYAGGQVEDAKAFHDQMIRAGFTPDKLSRRLLNNLPPRRRRHRGSSQSHDLHSDQSSETNKFRWLLSIESKELQPALSVE